MTHRLSSEEALSQFARQSGDEKFVILSVKFYKISFVREFFPLGRVPAPQVDSYALSKNMGSSGCLSERPYSLLFGKSPDCFVVVSLRRTLFSGRSAQIRGRRETEKQSDR